MADRTRTRKISDEALDELLAGRNPAEVFRGGALIDDLRKAVAERALDAEMDARLGREGDRDAGDHRNGRNRSGFWRIRERWARRLRGAGRGSSSRGWRRGARWLPGSSAKAASMRARGMATRETQGRAGELCGLGASPGLASKATGAVRGKIRERRARALGGVRAIACFDAARARIRGEGLAKARRRTSASGRRAPAARRRWIRGSQAGARLRLAAMNELRACGPRDAPVAAVDGLRGFPEAIGSVHLEAVAQACVARLIRHSPAHASLHPQAPSRDRR